MPASAPYIGRFAPSPFSALHFRSLAAALGSYLQARACSGQWRVRIEDIDPLREVPGAADNLNYASSTYSLQGRAGFISVAGTRLISECWRRGAQHSLSCYCDCTRSSIQSFGGYYDGHCRDRRIPAEGAAIRLRQTAPVFHFYNRLRGRIEAEPVLAREDFIIRRRDWLFAYNLAVVVDNAAMGVTEVLRGSALITLIERQLGYKEPDYVHLPLTLSLAWLKLSKQNHAAEAVKSASAAVMARYAP